MTRKLFYEDPYTQSFTAEITERGFDEQGVPYVVLGATAFYPTGGGQPCDLGTINGVEVVDVEEVDGRVLHRLAAALPEDATEAIGRIDWQRRVDLMQQHSGQHILSAAFEQVLDGETVGFHLGRETVTVDIALPDLTAEQIAEVETLANRVVLDNRPITPRFVEPEELAALPLRKAPSVTENIRIVTIDNYDYNPCGGTHPARTGEVGPIKILGMERYKGNVRVEFVCGWRTLQAMTEKQAILKNLSRQLTCSETELPDNLTRVLNERKQLEKALHEAQAKLTAVEAGEWLAAAVEEKGIKIVAAVLENRTIQQLKDMAQHITSREPQALALLASGGDKTQLVFARGSAVQVAVNELLKETLPLIEGKGGGNPAIAQGGGNASAAPEAVLAHARQVLAGKLA